MASMPRFTSPPLHPNLGFPIWGTHEHNFPSSHEYQISQVLLGSSCSSSSFRQKFWNTTSKSSNISMVCWVDCWISMELVWQVDNDCYVPVWGSEFVFCLVNSHSTWIRSILNLSRRRYNFIQLWVGTFLIVSDHVFGFREVLLSLYW